MKKSAFAILLGCFSILAACTKEVPYKYEFKEEVLNKSQVDTKGDYLYNVSLLETSRNMAEGTAFQFGDNKRVRLQWTEKSLRVIEQDRDERFSRDINNKTILDIPVDHVDYECAKDAYGDCTNSEAEKKTNWANKASFKIKATEAKQGALEFLPILFEESLGSPCNKEISSEVTGYEITKDAINLQVKRNFLQICIENVENSISETNFSAVFHYSIVRADAVLSKDFKPISYSKDDENTFGFFSSTYKKRDIDGNLVENAEKTVANHWNPNRSTIDFYLSDSFNKPQNKKLKEGSYEAVRQMNIGLKLSGAKFQIVLHEPEGKNPGDIRNSMIVLVEDPYSDAPLGYGPQTEDPVTGEIISARTIMYLSGLQQGVRVNYEEIARAVQIEKEKAANAAKIKVEEQDNGGLILDDGSTQSRVVSLAKARSMAAKRKTALNKPRSVVKGSGNLEARMALEKKSIRNYTSRVSDEYAARDQKAYYKYLTQAKNCSYRSEGSEGLAEVRPDLEEMIEKRFMDPQTGLLKPWKALTDAEKQEVMDVIIPEIWVPVLLHELGHNMGLRHNFKGSEDKDNYPTAEDLKANNINHKIPYSTIMEYGDDLRTLPFVGRYDIAAFRYAYSREVDVKDQAGNVSRVSLLTDLKDLNNQLKKSGQSLVEYGYCTDEHVGPNPGCRRFDEGVTYTEIAQYLVDSYHNRYQLRAMRNGMENFSSRDDIKYMMNRKNNFMDMRVFSETYERIKHMYGLTDDSEYFQSVEWLKDLQQAVLLTNRLMVDVIMTPDLHCALVNTQKPTNINQVVSLKMLEDVLGVSAFDCFDADLNDTLAKAYKGQFAIVGQTGKSMNDKKHPDNQNSYIDQIDVRGYWMDKWAASKVLFARQLSPSFDKNFDNAWDNAILRPELKDMLSSVIKNQVSRDQKFQLINGQEITLTVPLDFFDSQIIEKPMDAKLAKAAELTDGNVNLSQVLAANAVEEATLGNGNTQEGSELENLVTVKVAHALNDTTQLTDQMARVRIGSFNVYALNSNEIGYSLINDAVFQQKLGAIDREVLAKLNALVQEKLAAKEDITGQVLTAGVPELTAEQKSFLSDESLKNAAALAEKVDALASGMMMKSDNIVKTLFGLPRVDRDKEKNKNKNDKDNKD